MKIKTVITECMICGYNSIQHSEEKKMNSFVDTVCPNCQAKKSLQIVKGE